MTVTSRILQSDDELMLDWKRLGQRLWFHHWLIFGRSLLPPIPVLGNPSRYYLSQIHQPLETVGTVMRIALLLVGSAPMK